MPKKSVVIGSSIASVVGAAVVAVVLVLVLRKQTTSFTPCESSIVASDGKKTCTCAVAHAGRECELECGHIMNGVWKLNDTPLTFESGVMGEKRYGLPSATWFDESSGTLNLSVGMWNLNSDQVKLVVAQNDEIMTEMNVDYFAGIRRSSCFIPPHVIPLKSGDTLSRQLTSPQLQTDDIQLTACKGDDCDPNTADVIIPLMKPPFHLSHYTVKRVAEGESKTWTMSGSTTTVNDSPPPGDYTYIINYTLTDGSSSPDSNFSLTVPEDLQSLCPPGKWDSVVDMCETSSPFHVNLAPLVVTFENGSKTPLTNQNGTATWGEGIVGRRNDESNDRLWFDSVEKYVNPVDTYSSISLGFRPQDGGMNMRIIIHAYLVDFIANSENIVIPDPDFANNIPPRMGTYMGEMMFPTPTLDATFTLTDALTSVGRDITLISPTQPSMIFNMSPVVNTGDIQFISPSGAVNGNKHLILPCEQMCLDLSEDVPSLCLGGEALNPFTLTYTIPYRSDPNFIYTPIPHQNGNISWGGPPISEMRQDDTQTRLWFDTLQTYTNPGGTYPILSLGFRLNDAGDAMTVRIILNAYIVTFIEDSDNVVTVDPDLSKNIPKRLGTHSGQFTFPPQNKRTKFSLTQALRQLNTFELEHSTKSDQTVMLTLSPQCMDLGGYSVYVAWTGIEDAYYDLDRVREGVVTPLLSKTQETSYTDANLPYSHLGGSYVVRYTDTNNIAFTFVGPQKLSDVYCNSKGSYVASKGSCTCTPTYSGPSCDVVCYNRGNLINDECVCVNDNVDPSTCAYTRDATCNGAGDPDVDGACICDDADRQNSICQYTSLDTCNGNGQPNSEGQCDCNHPSITNEDCAYTREDTCNGHGDPDAATGECDCDEPTITNSSCAYTREDTCNGHGDPSPSTGECECDEPSRVANDRCEYTSSSACNDQGYLDEDGKTCVCNIGYSELMNEDCAYTDETTCNGHGTVASAKDSTCTCDYGWSGASCTFENTYYGCDLESAPLNIQADPVVCGQTCKLARGNWRLSTASGNFTFSKPSIREDGVRGVVLDGSPWNDVGWVGLTRIWYISDQGTTDGQPRIALGFREANEKHEAVEVVAIITNEGGSRSGGVTNISYANRDDCFNSLIFEFTDFTLSWSPGSPSITRINLTACDATIVPNCQPFRTDVEIEWEPPYLEPDVNITSYTLTRTHITNAAEFNDTFTFSPNTTFFVDRPHTGQNTYTLNFTANFQRQDGISGESVRVDVDVPEPSADMCRNIWDPITGLCTATPFTMILDDIQLFFTHDDVNYPVPNNDHAILTFSSPSRIEERIIDGSEKNVAVFDSDQPSDASLAFTPLNSTQLWMEISATLWKGRPFIDFAVDYSELEVTSRNEQPSFFLDKQRSTVSAILNVEDTLHPILLQSLLTQPLHLSPPNLSDISITLRKPLRILHPLYVTPPVVEAYDFDYSAPRNTLKMKIGADLPPPELTQHSQLTLYMNQTVGEENVERIAWEYNNSNRISPSPIHYLTFDTTHGADGTTTLTSTQKTFTGDPYVILHITPQPPTFDISDIYVTLNGTSLIDGQEIAQTPENITLNDYPTPMANIPTTLNDGTSNSSFTLTSYHIVHPGEMILDVTPNYTYTYNFYYTMSDGYASDVISHTINVEPMQAYCANPTQWSDLTQQCFPQLNVSLPSLQLTRILMGTGTPLPRAVTQYRQSIITFKPLPELSSPTVKNATWDVNATRLWFTSQQNYQIFESQPNERGELVLNSQNPTLKLGFRYLPNGRMEMVIVAQIYTNGSISDIYVQNPSNRTGTLTTFITFDGQYTEFFDLAHALTHGNPISEDVSLAPQTEGFTFPAFRKQFAADLRMLPVPTPPPQPQLSLGPEQLSLCLGNTVDDACAPNVANVELNWTGPSNTSFTLQRTNLVDNTLTTLLSNTHTFTYQDIVPTSANYTYILNIAYPTEEIQPITRNVTVPSFADICSSAEYYPVDGLCLPLTSIPNEIVVIDPVITHPCMENNCQQTIEGLQCVCANIANVTLGWNTGLNPLKGVYTIEYRTNPNQQWNTLVGPEAPMDASSLISFEHQVDVTTPLVDTQYRFSARDNQYIIDPIVTTVDVPSYSPTICATHPADNAWGHELYHPDGFCYTPTPEQNNAHCMSTAPDTYYGTNSNTCSPLVCSDPVSLADGTVVENNQLYADIPQQTITKHKQCYCSGVGIWDEEEATCYCTNEDGLPGYWDGHTCNYAPEYCEGDGVLDSQKGTCTWPVGWDEQVTQITPCIEDICAGTRRVDLGIIFPFNQGTYVIQRKYEGADWTQVDTSDFSASTARFAEDVPVGTNVEYRVRADGTGEQDWYKRAEWTTQSFSNPHYTETECNDLQDTNPLGHRILNVDYCGLPSTSMMQDYCQNTRTNSYQASFSPYKTTLNLYDPETNACQPVTPASNLGDPPTLGTNGRPLTREELESAFGTLPSKNAVNTQGQSITYTDLSNGVWDMYTKQESCFHGTFNTSQNKCECEPGWGGNLCQFEEKLFCNGVGTISDDVHASAQVECTCPLTTWDSVNDDLVWSGVYKRTGYIGNNCQNNLCCGGGYQEVEWYGDGGSTFTCHCEDGTTSATNPSITCSTCKDHCGDGSKHLINGAQIKWGVKDGRNSLNDTLDLQLVSNDGREWRHTRDHILDNNPDANAKKSYNVVVDFKDNARAVQVTATRNRNDGTFTQTIHFTLSGSSLVRDPDHPSTVYICTPDGNVIDHIKTDGSYLKFT
jgi:hypothetical protein